MTRIYLTQSQRNRLAVEWNQYNKDNKRRHYPVVTFDEFIDIKFGKKQSIQPVQSKPPEPYRRGSDVQYKSASSIPNTPAATAKQEKKVYSGTLIKGIATMHKSNAVPVLNTKEATDIANMRR